MHMVYHYERKLCYFVALTLGGLFHAEGGVINKGTVGSPTALKVELCPSAGIWKGLIGLH